MYNKCKPFCKLSLCSRMQIHAQSSMWQESNSDNGFFCHVCEKEFTRRSSVYRHVTEVHQKLKRERCDECNSTFARKFDLSRHILAVHEGARPYSCEFCSATFSQKGNRNKHVHMVHMNAEAFCAKPEKGAGNVDDNGKDLK